MSRVVHFEFPSTDAAASRKFYENVFGWEFSEYSGASDYLLVATGEPGTPGINGAIGGAANELKATVNTVDVDDLDETIRKVLANGGQVIMPKGEVPGVGWVAYAKEPGGNVFGMFQYLPGFNM